MDTPSEMLYAWAFSLYFEGKGAPVYWAKLKELRGQGPLEGGVLGGGLPAKFFMFIAFFLGPDSLIHKMSKPVGVHEPGFRTSSAKVRNFGLVASNIS